MSRAKHKGTCEHCGEAFSYALVHSGFHESAFAYCDLCGQTAILNAGSAAIPEAVGFPAPGPLPSDAEPYLLPCACGGSFRSRASPRCPQCSAELSARRARSWIEAQAPGAAKGWRWQGSWSGLYAIVIEGRVVQDVWRGPG